ncbi:MAG: hypothetical protein ABSE66_03730 [Thermoplasmata archaeon]|jgi:hypothetical protein
MRADDCDGDVQPRPGHVANLDPIASIHVDTIRETQAMRDRAIRYGNVRDVWLPDVGQNSDEAGLGENSPAINRHVVKANAPDRSTTAFGHDSNYTVSGIDSIGTRINPRDFDLAGVDRVEQLRVYRSVVTRDFDGVALVAENESAQRRQASNIGVQLNRHVTGVVKHDRVREIPGAIVGKFPAELHTGCSG